MQEILQCEVVVPSDIEDINLLTVILEPELPYADWHLGALVFLDPLVPVHHGLISDEEYPHNTGLLENLLPSCSKKGITVDRVGGANGTMDIKCPIFQYFLTRQGLAPKNQECYHSYRYQQQ